MDLSHLWFSAAEKTSIAPVICFWCIVGRLRRAQGHSLMKRLPVEVVSSFIALRLRAFRLNGRCDANGPSCSISVLKRVRVCCTSGVSLCIFRWLFIVGRRQTQFVVFSVLNCLLKRLWLVNLKYTRADTIPLLVMHYGEGWRDVGVQSLYSL